MNDLGRRSNAIARIVQQVDVRVLAVYTLQIDFYPVTAKTHGPETRPIEPALNEAFTLFVVAMVRMLETELFELSQSPIPAHLLPMIGG